MEPLERRNFLKVAGAAGLTTNLSTERLRGANDRITMAFIGIGALGDITWCKTWSSTLAKKEGFGNPPDSAPPPDLDWDMWLGPAPKVPFNENRWGVKKATFPTFRYFWDYAGGEMTDWGIHFI